MFLIKFNTTTKEVVVYSNIDKMFIFAKFSSVPTVKVRPESFYEIMKLDEEGKQVPVMRLPISSTIMEIEN
jgi:hypothetical protein